MGCDDENSLILLRNGWNGWKVRPNTKECIVRFAMENLVAILIASYVIGLYEVFVDSVYKQIYFFT